MKPVRYRSKKHGPLFIPSHAGVIVPNDMEFYGHSNDFVNRKELVEEIAGWLKENLTCKQCASEYGAPDSEFEKIDCADIHEVFIKRFGGAE